MTADLRRLEAAGATIGVFTDAPEELARVALSHLGAARRVTGIAQAPEQLGKDVVVVRSSEELARLEL